MNKLDAVFRQLRREQRKAFIPFVMAGDPSLAQTASLVDALVESGADVVELGVPFSDPLADGPTIQRAAQRALRHQVSLADVLGLVRRLRRRHAVPLVLLTYYNPVYRFGEGAGRGAQGPRRFLIAARVAGVDGVIIPDLPAEEARSLVAEARRQRVAAILLAAPTSSPARLTRIVRMSRGFIYFVSLTGTTGARRHLPVELEAQVRRLRRMTRTPVCVGFGIAAPQEARRVARVADGVIVGSALVRVIERHRGRRLKQAVGRFARQLRRAI
ncbi:MAG: tryptophan synthase subunit alpha [Candidatus Omnitrophica bacterium]|nr:tryptophan synthase subunit alpha [Candidatus Omnitrophota bacterium]